MSPGEWFRRQRASAIALLPGRLGRAGPGRGRQRRCSTTTSLVLVNALVGGDRLRAPGHPPRVLAGTPRWTRSVPGALDPGRAGRARPWPAGPATSSRSAPRSVVVLRKPPPPGVRGPALAHSPRLPAPRSQPQRLAGLRVPVRGYRSGGTGQREPAGRTTTGDLAAQPGPRPAVPGPSPLQKRPGSYHCGWRRAGQQAHGLVGGRYEFPRSTPSPGPGSGPWASPAGLPGWLPAGSAATVGGPGAGRAGG